MPDTTLPTEKQLKKKLAELEQKTHLPHDMLAVVTKVTEAQIAALSCVSLPEEIPLEQHGAAARSQGAALLSPPDFPLDMATATRLVSHITEAVAGHAPHLAGSVGAVRDFLEASGDTFPQAAQECLQSFSGSLSPRSGKSTGSKSGTENPQVLALWKQQHPEAPELLRFVVQSALMPSLAVAGRRIGQSHTAGTPWGHGHCPVCGSLPYIGALQGREGTRSHVCSCCAFEFRVPRIGCPFCLDESPQAGEYFAAEEEPGFRLEICRSCKTYIKVADFREFDRVWFPQLDDLSSITLDLYARQMGFMRPTLSAWGF